MHWCYPETLASPQEHLSLLEAAALTPVRVNKRLEYIVGWLGSVFCFTVTILSDQIIKCGQKPASWTILYTMYESSEF